MTFLDEHKEQLSLRYPTLRIALDLLKDRVPQDAIIIETGCARMENDWGAGLSTLVFAHWCRENSGHLYSVDISLQNLQTARRIIGDELAPFATFIHSDSVQFLRKVRKHSIDLLYLDSWDYPWGEMLNRHGGQTDIQKAIETLWAMNEDDVLEQHGDLIHPCQVHCRKELFSAMHALKDTSIVLIDDQNFPGGGKPRLAKRILARCGWQELSKPTDQQSLWIWMQ